MALLWRRLPAGIESSLVDEKISHNYQFSHIIPFATSGVKKKEGDVEVSSRSKMTVVIMPARSQ
jgi:hypothetical protein